MCLQASKGAVIRFYETLRSELGSHVRITILMPGYVESNLTMGKGIQKDGNVGIDEEARDVHIHICLSTLDSLCS
jgi:NAD(P)-dependent dehydrogenase (short-subunit alcohol dehydrogenase family)